MDVAGSYIGDAYLLSRGFSAAGTTDVPIAGLGVQTVPNGRQPTPHWGNQFSVEATQVLYAGGALTAAMRMAKIGKRMAQLQVEQNRQEVLFVLTGYYLDLIRLQNRQQVIDRHILLSNRLLEMMRLRQEAGTTLSTDVLRYKLQVKQLELERVRLCDAESILQHQLQTMLHTPTPILPDTAFVAQEYARLTQAVDESFWQQQATASNLSLRQSQAAEEMATQQVKTTRAAAIPQLALVLHDELFGPYTGDLIPTNANVNAWFVGIGIHYDIDQLWHNHQAVRQAQARQRIAQQQTQHAQETLCDQVYAAFTAFMTTFTEVDTRQAQQQLADENYRLVTQRYENDLALLTDLLDASSAKLSADMALVNARLDLLYSFYQLQYITHSL